MDVAEVINRALHEHVCGPWPSEICCWSEKEATCAETVAQMPGMGRAVEHALIEAGLVTTARCTGAAGAQIDCQLTAGDVCVCRASDVLGDTVRDLLAEVICYEKHHQRDPRGACPNCRSRAATIHAPYVIPAVRGVVSSPGPTGGEPGC